MQRKRKRRQHLRQIDTGKTSGSELPKGRTYSPPANRRKVLYILSKQCKPVQLYKKLSRFTCLPVAKAYRQAMQVWPHFALVRDNPKPQKRQRRPRSKAAKIEKPKNRKKEKRGADQRAASTATAATLAERMKKSKHSKCTYTLQN